MQNTLVEQWQNIKNALPKDTILLFRLGDFYEAFFEDAGIIAKVFNLVITKRNNIPMCGYPYHAHDRYMNILLKQYKVAVCEKIDNNWVAKNEF